MATKKNKFIIHLGKTTLTDEQRKNLHTAIHNTMVKEIKAIAKEANKKVTTEKPAATDKGLTRAVAVTATKTANLKVTFTTVAIGKSALTATFGTQVKAINQSDTITFTGLSRGDMINIDGASLGSTIITIDIDANPAQMNFTPGNFNDNFLIR